MNRNKVFMSQKEITEDYGTECAQQNKTFRGDLCGSGTGYPVIDRFITDFYRLQ